MNKFMWGFFAGAIIAFAIVSIESYQDKKPDKEMLYWQSRYPLMTEKIYKKIVLECDKQDIYNKVNMINKPKDIGKRIIFGIVSRESDWLRYERGLAGEYSFMQIMYYHLPKELQKHPEVLYDIDMHFEIGIKYFAECLDKSKGNILEAVNRFNKGKSKKIDIDYLSEIFKNIYME